MLDAILPALPGRRRPVRELNKNTLHPHISPHVGSLASKSLNFLRDAGSELYPHTLASGVNEWMSLDG